MEIAIIESKRFDVIASLVEEVQQLHADLFPSIYKSFDYDPIKQAMEVMLNQEHCRVFVALVQGKSVGYALVLIKEIPESAFHYGFRFLHIDQLAVAQQYRKSGVGSMLIRKVEVLARELGVIRIELDHLHRNTAAADFFRSKAFTPYRNKLVKIIG